MCGFAGALSFRNSAATIEEATIVRMRDVLAHRGPDGAGVWVSPDRRIGLGHRRLSIIDLSALANQPMSSRGDTLWLAFNGEIYNHADIRRELEQRGHRTWKTDHSDTEVILRAFEEWGIECIHRFRGMFAFALWDARKRELWLVRDRIGIKPLYYSVHHGRITFASEIKALLQDPDQRRRVNEDGLYDYLSFITTPSPDTLFEGIHKVPSGTYLRVTEDGTIHEHRYWDVLDHTQPLVDVPEDEIASRILDELRTAVRLRQVSDVPVGVFLSGGIDSSTNAALFSQGSNSVRTFTIGYEGSYDTYRNELDYARTMAQAVHADHHELLLNVDDLISFLPKMVYLQDEPIGDPVCVPVYYVSKLARDNGVIVCQVGEGADELFWGYPTWKIRLRLQQADALPVPRFAKSLLFSGYRRLASPSSLPLEALRRSVAGQPVFWGGVDAFTEPEKKQLLSPRLRARFADRSSWQSIDPIWQRYQQKAWEKAPLQWMSYLDLNLRLPELLLMRVDKMSMAVGLEGRVPFLDHKLVELAMSIPQSVKTRNGTLKYILKKAVRGLIPDELIDRKKQGFGVPVYEWLFGKLGTQVRDELDRFCRATDLFDRTAIERLSGNRPDAKLWYLFNVALWWREYFA